MSDKELPFKRFGSTLVGWWVEDANGEIFVRCRTKDQADFICLCCNSHKDLTEALEKINEIEEGCKSRNVGYDYLVHQTAKAALRKGEVK